MEILFGIILFIIMIIDVKTYKIYNIYVLPLIVLGIVYQIYENGLEGMFFSLKGIILIFLSLIIVWVIKMMGAGDIKLLMAIAAFFGYAFAIKLFAYSMVVLIIIYIFMIGIKQFFEIFKEFFYLIFYKIPLLSKRKRTRLQYSVPIFITYVVMLIVGL